MDINDFAEHLFAGRWMAGTNILDAIKNAQRLNSLGITAIMNYLGEELTKEAQVSKAVDMYIKLIRYIKNYKIKADISVKPTQLGLSISESEASANYSKIVAEARLASVFVWLDMEGENTVDSTIRLYASEVQNSGVGICMQAYLKRTESDIQKLAKLGAIIRLVKGAYSTSKSKGFITREAITKNYANLMRIVFEQYTEFTIATHDMEMIHNALKMNETYKRKLTIAMLQGIRNRTAAELAKKNKVSIYTPFGEQWVSYSYRRLKEAGHLKLVLKSLLEKQGV